MDDTDTTLLRGVKRDMVIDDEEIVESARTTRLEKTKKKEEIKMLVDHPSHSSLLPTLSDYSTFSFIFYFFFVCW